MIFLIRNNGVGINLVLFILHKYGIPNARLKAAATQVKDDVLQVPTIF